MLSPVKNTNGVILEHLEPAQRVALNALPLLQKQHYLYSILCI